MPIAYYPTLVWCYICARNKTAQIATDSGRQTSSKINYEMILITQLIYIIDGQEKVFDEFESIAIPTILKYNGRLLFRIRPAEDNFIEIHIDKPYEVHLVEFQTQQDFVSFLNDEERKKFLHLKEQSIREAILIQGTKL